MFSWTVPDELVSFIYSQFDRFSAEPPSEKCVDTTASFIIEYVAKNNYYPTTSEEAAARYEKPGLTEPEKVQLLGPLEYQLKLHFNQRVSIEQLHLSAWAALLFCWSEGGETHVDWYHKMDTQMQSWKRATGNVV